MWILTDILSIFVVTSSFCWVLAASDPSTISFIHQRRSQLLPRDVVNFATLPQCATPHCDLASSLTPSRLGCVEPSLTKHCLCTVAIQPLACVPSGPSSEDNCWYEVEDWFAGQCDKQLPLIPRDSMPSCLANCTINWLRMKGCRTDSRNCFCKLDADDLVPAVENCRSQGCMKHMQPEFDVEFWREQLCTQGEIEPYNESAYRKRRKLVKNVRIIVPIFLGVALISGLAYTLFLWYHNRTDNLYRTIVLVVAVGGASIAVLVLVPIYVAL